MKTIGMIGGLGPESTVDYYKRIIEEYRKITDNGTYPKILINSVDMTAVLKMTADKNLSGLADLLADSINALYKAGADFGFISANTPHIVFDEVQKLSPIPLISIVEETCKAAQKHGLKNVGLMGTLFTMKSSFYQKVFNAHNISVAVPFEIEQQYIHQKLMDEIELGHFFSSTRAGLLDIAKRMINENRVDGIVLGCTELPLIITKDEFGVPFLNTTQIHVESIVDACLL